MKKRLNSSWIFRAFTNAFSAWLGVLACGMFYAFLMTDTGRTEVLFGSVFYESRPVEEGEFDILFGVSSLPIAFIIYLIILFLFLIVSYVMRHKNKNINNSL
ncbi:MAG: hypothetical protein J6M18_05340 [Actinomycetaceae bacterium]|nr:hypothetical protein [Actinomycetaceae bacterium]